MSNRLVATATLIAAASVLWAPGVASAAEGDTAFVQRVHQDNVAAIAAGDDAQRHAATACVKDVGALLVRDHGALEADLRMRADDPDVDLASSPTAEQHRGLAAVQSAAGTSAYDARWLADQDAAHTRTLALIDKVLSSGGDADVTAAARAARRVVAADLELVRGGTCHLGSEAGMAGAGSRGLASRRNGLNAVGAAGLTGGILATAVVTLWLARRRPTGFR
ncbi:MULTISPECIES: DUF4142 domain-containing protein [unclassified Streptomyces]|uniref:DUF4142 domain-containing protein n=1 Tax=unclassified Streptomyces TaxID=2593676 RepID=UPI002E30CD8C|nr:MULTISPECIES: DUF4142 domain-containing protein [unclassified Streptomyces]